MFPDNFESVSKAFDEYLKHTQQSAKPTQEEVAREALQASRQYQKDWQRYGVDRIYHTTCNFDFGGTEVNSSPRIRRHNRMDYLLKAHRNDTKNKQRLAARYLVGVEDI